MPRALTADATALLRRYGGRGEHGYPFGIPRGDVLALVRRWGRDRLADALAAVVGRLPYPQRPPSLGEAEAALRRLALRTDGGLSPPPALASVSAVRHVPPGLRRARVLAVAPMSAPWVVAFSERFHFADRRLVRTARAVSAAEAWRDHPRAVATRAVVHALVGDHRQPERHKRAGLGQRELWAALRERSALRSAGHWPAPVARDLVLWTGAQDALDWCGGWGDRLAGFLTAGAVLRRATVIEPRASACAAFNEQVRLAAAVLDRVPRVDIMCAAAERALPRMRAASFDLVLTSMPYADLEVYADRGRGGAPCVSDTFGSSVAAFVAGFLRPCVRHSVRLLRRGGWLCLNVADYSPPGGGGVVRLVDPTLAAARDAGAQFVGVVLLRRQRGWRPGGSEDAEPLLVWRRP